MQNVISEDCKIHPKIAKSAKRFKLTTRQTQTVELLSRGEPRKSIAEILGISERRVQTIIENFRMKIGGQTTISALSKFFLA